MSEDVVTIKNITKSYEEGHIKALNGISLNIKKGEFISIIGPSGSGKSTLLNMLGALDKPDSGEIIVAGEDLKKSKKLNEFRAKKIGFIFQLHNLIPNISTVENVELPMYGHGVKSKNMREKALNALKFMGLEDRADILPTKLSGGQRQRVAIARALINDPEIILADEPTGALDSENSKKVMNLLKKMHEEKNVTLIVITHDLEIAKMAQRTIRVLDGKIIEE
jgi:putative ABC transport system ATP-binding protein